MIYAALGYCLVCILGPLAFWLRSAKDRSAIILIPVGAFLLIGFIQPLGLTVTGALSSFVSSEQAFRSVMFSGSACLCLWIGWLAFKRGRIVHRRLVCLQQSADQLYFSGLMLAVVGIVAQAYFVAISGGLAYYSSHYNSTVNYDVTNAYVYLSPFLIGAGLIVINYAISAKSINKTIRHAKSRKMLFFGIYGLFALHSVLVSSRAMFFATTVVLLIPKLTAHPNIISIRKMLITSLLIAMGIVSMVVFRGTIYWGTSYENMHVDATSLDWLVTSTPEHRDTGNEFLYQTLLISQVDRTNNFALGRGYLEAVTLHVIPRMLWPDKPNLSAGAIEAQLNIREHYGVAIPFGAFPGLAGDLYLNFGYGSLLIWVGIGYLLNISYRSVAEKANIFLVVLYGLIYMTSLNLFVQDFRQGVIFGLYCIAPTWFLMWLCLRSRSGKSIRWQDTQPVTHGVYRGRVHIGSNAVKYL